MLASVLIPTYRRPARLAACLRALSAQTIDGFEVLVGIDGPDGESVSAARGAWSVDPARLTVAEFPREGYNASRNRLLAAARGRVMISINDDVAPDPAFVEVHTREHAPGVANGRPAVVVGRSPWRRPADPTVFDLLVQRTSMIFFYDRMDTPEGLADPGRDWGYRHAYGLNLSAPLDLVRRAGGFTALPLAYGYDDLELAWRLKAHFGLPVLYRPGAHAEHDHRYTPAEVLDREERLGSSAWGFAWARPAFAIDLFGRDLRSPAESAYARAFVERESAAADRAREGFLALGRTPAPASNDPASPALIRWAAEGARLLRRWHWNTGYLRAAHASAGALGPALARPA
ncbi:MAG: glycosyltransferase family 2 protein [Phycisphaeraceae bacterium]|nr:MAG: glycosyltransferase family 2 protein [Phycisphaeraceae bacterium]